MSFWNLFSKKKKELILDSINIQNVNTDMHAHWLPGIDDGAQTIEESFDIIKTLHELGYKKLIATPHVMSDFYNNSSSLILQKLEEVKKYVSSQNLAIELEASAEYYFDEEFIKRIKENDLLTIGKSKYVLFEFSYLNEPNQLFPTITDLISKNFRPILAHPERYNYFAENPQKYHELKNMGLYFQVNLMSLAGNYGESAKIAAHYLIDNNMIDFIGTDIHKDRHFNPIMDSLKTPKLHELINQDKILNREL